MSLSLKRTAVAVSALLASSVAFGDGGGLTAKDLIELTELGLKEFERSYGRASYDSVYAITSAISDDGDGATLKYFYGDPAQRKFATFFCHDHSPGHTDCHEVR